MPEKGGGRKSALLLDHDNILDVLVRIGSCEIGGELLVSHVTRESEERVLCGGRFYPASETDRLQMTKAIMCLESLQES